MGESFMKAMLRPLTAEFIGTFGLVFVGAGAIVTDQARGNVGLLGIAFAHGMVFAIMVTATMRISGGHLNPAITFGLWLANKIDARGAGLYVATQLVAGIVAALLVMLLFPAMAGEVTGYGVPRIAADVSFIESIFIEAILTFFLVSAVFGTTVSEEAPNVGGFGIGLVLVFAILAGGPLTGAALNPARALGPALVSGEWQGHAAYWLGPLLGGGCAGLLWWKLLLPSTAQAA
jgi:aquaporin Z